MEDRERFDLMPKSWKYNTSRQDEKRQGCLYERFFHFFTNCDKVDNDKNAEKILWGGGYAKKKAENEHSYHK